MSLELPTVLPYICQSPASVCTVQGTLGGGSLEVVDSLRLFPDMYGTF